MILYLRTFMESSPKIRFLIFFAIRPFIFTHSLRVGGCGVNEGGVSALVSRKNNNRPSGVMLIGQLDMSCKWFSYSE